MNVVRLRQAVVAATDRDSVWTRWHDEFGLGDGFSDPGVGEFGLQNWVVPVGDTFLEVVSPVREGTTAGRYMARHGGDAGYMVIFQVTDIEEARAHLQQQQCRTVWNGDFDSISGTHLHPADIGGAIVSIDQPRPAPTWLWAGPRWESNVRTTVTDRLAGIVVADANPDALAATWARLLNLSIVDNVANLPDGSRIAFVASDSVGGRSGIVGIDLRLAANADLSKAEQCVRIANTDFRLVAH